MIKCVDTSLTTQILSQLAALKLCIG